MSTSTPPSPSAPAPEPSDALEPSDVPEPSDALEPSNALEPSDVRESSDSPEPSDRSVSRRHVLGTATAGAAGITGLTLGAPGSALAHAPVRERLTDAVPALTTVGSTAERFHGTHQPGILTPRQTHGHLIAFDLAPAAGRKEAAVLLRRWSKTARELMHGRPVSHGTDTGISLDAGPSSLTVTFGFGGSFFDRTGLTDLRPTALTPLPHFSGDAIDPRRSDGDLWVQIGADDPLVAFHALRELQREAAVSPDGSHGDGGIARVRWQMSGFNRTPGATKRPMTIRNLMGQMDGTNNPQPTDPGFDDHVFVPLDGAPAWMAGGSYAVVRRIRVLLDSWDQESLSGQEEVIGRRKSDGAPLSGGEERTPADLAKRDAEGELIIARNAHIRVAAPGTNDGATMLRRSYSYHDGFLDDGSPDAGLLFICWQADPHRSFVPVQRKLDRADALSRYVRHETSALFAVPGGVEPGEYVGQRLLEG